MDRNGRYCQNGHMAIRPHATNILECGIPENSNNNVALSLQILWPRIFFHFPSYILSHIKKCSPLIVYGSINSFENGMGGLYSPL